MQYDLAPSTTEPLNASAVQADAEAALRALDVGTFGVTVQGANNNTVNIRLRGFSRPVRALAGAVRDGRLPTALPFSWP